MKIEKKTYKDNFLKELLIAIIPAIAFIFFAIVILNLFGCSSHRIEINPCQSLCQELNRNDKKLKCDSYLNDIYKEANYNIDDIEQECSIQYVIAKNEG